MPTKTQPPALDAPCHQITLSAGTISYYVDNAQANGRPLVLLHSINAAPSAREMQPLFDHYRHSRTVYVPDLPGYGRSERSDQLYSPELYARFIREFLEQVVGQPADIVAFSLSAEFAARAIVEHSVPVDSLALISPTGFSARRAPTGPITDRILKFLRLPVLGDGLYKLLTSRLSIRYFLGLSFAGKAPEPLTDYAYTTAHQPGAKFAPFRFLSMKLFTPTAVEDLYTRLELPVLVLYDRDPNISFELLDSIEKKPNWRTVRISPTMGLPHWERPQETAAALDAFWADRS